MPHREVPSQQFRRYLTTLPLESLVLVLLVAISVTVALGLVRDLRTRSVFIASALAGISSYSLFVMFPALGELGGTLSAFRIVGVFLLATALWFLLARFVQRQARPR